MSDGWYETIAAIGGITAVSLFALAQGKPDITIMGMGALSLYLAAKVHATSTKSPPT